MQETSRQERESSASAAEVLELYKTVRTIRVVEQRLATMFADGKIPGFIHLSVGQEAIPAGISAALNPRDTVASNHRGHGHAIAKGLALDRFFLEIMGKAQGYCGGRGGSMHVASMDVGMLGANGIVGAGVPIAVGSALAHRQLGTGAIAVAYFGDGALAEGAFTESLNLASLWNLPLLFVCENNGWSEFSPTERQFAADVKALAQTFNIAAEEVNGMDAVAVSAAAKRIVREIRETSRPRLLECKAKRFRGHFEGDPQKYRSDLETISDPKNDPLTLLVDRLKILGTSGKKLAEIDASIDSSVDAAVRTAETGSPPQLDETLAGVYADVTP